MKLSNTIWGVLLARFARMPFYARLHVTHRCTQRCRMCAVPGSAGPQEEMGVPEYAHLARILRRLRVPHVVLTGGEPFLRPDLPDIVGVLARERISVRVQTNGGPQVTEDLLRRAVRAGLTDVSVSIDTLDPEKQDRICNGRNVLASALRVLRLSARLMPGGISQANVVASTMNLGELPELVDHFHRMGSYVYITPVMVADGREEDWLFRAAASEFAFTREDGPLAAEVVTRLIAQKRSGLRLTNSTRYLRDFARHARGEEAAFPCEAGELYFDIHPSGSLSICKEKSPFLNVLDRDFPARFHSREYQRSVRSQRAGCAGCFYGEYREPWYAVHDLGVFTEWTRGYLRHYRRGHRGPLVREESELRGVFS